MAKIGLDKLFASKEILDFTKAFNAELTRAANTIDKISPKKPLKGTGEDLKKTNKELKELNKLSKEQIKINKEAENRLKSIQKIRKQGIAQRDKVNRQIVKQKIAREEEAKAIKKEERAEFLLQIAQKKGIKSYNDLAQATNALVAKRNALDISNKKGQREFDKLSQKIKKNTNTLKKYDKAIGRSLRNVGNYAGAVRNLAGVFGVTFGARVVVDFFRDSLKGYEQQIVAERKLETVLKQRTGATKEQIQTVKDLTGEQQKLGIIEDEIQIAGAQQISTFVTQTKSVKTLIPALNNLIAQQKGFSATQQDAVNIANLAGKALQGQLGALTRVGITFTEAEGKILKYGNEQERAATLAQVITNNVGEMNKSLAETPLGKIQQVENIMGDLKEQVGGFVAGALFKFASLLKETIDILSGPNSLSSALQRVRDLFREQFDAVSNLISSFRGANAEAIKLRDVINRIGDAVNFALGFVRSLIQFNTKLIQGWTFLINKGRDVLEFLGILNKEERLRQEELERLQEEERKRQESIAAYTERLKELNKVTEVNTKVTKDNNKEKKKQVDLNKELDKLLQDQLKAEEERSKKEEEAFKKGLKDQFDIEVLNFEKKQALDKQEFATFTKTEKDKALFAKVQAQELLEFKTAAQLKYLELVKSLGLEETEAGQARLESQIEKLKAVLAEAKQEFSPDETQGEEKFSIWKLLGLTEEEEKKAKQIWENTKTVLLEVNNQIKASLDNQINKYDELISKSDERINSLQSELNEQIKRDKDGDASTKDSLQARLEAEQETQRKLIAGRERAAKRQKQIAITEATINTALSVTNALSQKPFILGLILAITAAAKGIAEINKIRNAQFYEGTESVPLNGNRPGRDTVPAMLTAKERVVPVGINEKLHGIPNKILPLAVNHFLSKDFPDNDGGSYSILSNYGMETRQDETNRILKDYTGREKRYYDSKGKIKEIVHENVTTSFV